MSDDRIPAEFQKPVGGVHRAVIEGNKTPKGAFSRATCETWGVYGGPKWQLPNDWKRKIQEPESLDDIRDRKTRRIVERVVSHEVRGVWVAGAAALDGDAVHRILKEDGYRFLGEEEFADGDVPYIVEYYGRSDALEEARELVERFKEERTRKK